MTIERITLRCNGPITDRGPISSCDATYTARAYTGLLARRHAAAEGWTIHRLTNLPVNDLCPRHSADTHTTG